MILTTIAQSQSTIVYKYSLVFSNGSDTEKTVAAFDHVPTSIDWQPWRDNWGVLGYTLQGEPQLIQSH